MKLYPYQQQYLDLLLSDKQIKCMIKSRKIGYSYVEKMLNEYRTILFYRQSSKSSSRDLYNKWKRVI